jgi:hypothetical protein
MAMLIPSLSLTIGTARFGARRPAKTIASVWNSKISQTGLQKYTHHSNAPRDATHVPALLTVQSGCLANPEAIVDLESKPSAKAIDVLDISHPYSWRNRARSKRCLSTVVSCDAFHSLYAWYAYPAGLMRITIQAWPGMLSLLGQLYR